MMNYPKIAYLLVQLAWANVKHVSNNYRYNLKISFLDMRISYNKRVLMFIRHMRDSKPGSALDRLAPVFVHIFS
jgi:hypothetical protein